MPNDRPVWLRYLVTIALALPTLELSAGEQLWAELLRSRAYTWTGMGDNGTLLCIHRDPAQLSLLQENGYELVNAINGSEGLRLLRARSVDAIVLEYHLGLLDGATVATEIKKVKPQLPIVMLADHLELPDGALKSVDAVVTKADGAHFLWATVHFILNVKRNPRERATLSGQVPYDIDAPHSWHGGERSQPHPL